MWQRFLIELRALLSAYKVIELSIRQILSTFLGYESDVKKRSNVIREFSVCERPGKGHLALTNAYFFGNGKKG